MNPNLNSRSVADCRTIVLWKLSYAVTSCLISELIMLLLFPIIVKTNFNLYLWFVEAFDTVTSPLTWLYLAPFVAIVFIQSIICAKDYVLVSSYSPSRFWRFVSVFSVHNFLLLVTHLVSGGFFVFTYLGVCGGEFHSWTARTERGPRLVEENLLLISLGVWTGFYYFCRVQTSDKTITFPVVFQGKLQHFKSRFRDLVNKSRKDGLAPTLYFLLFYYLFGPGLCDCFATTFNLHRGSALSLWVYPYAWLFTTLYFLKMSLMRLYFDLFLTEPVYFPIESDSLTLAQAVTIADIPVIQHLACLDAYMLSFWCSERRKQLFLLSQPGGHPHNWNHLISNLLKIITDYTDTLNKSTLTLLEPEAPKPPASPLICSPPPLSKNPHLRNMSYREPEPLDIVHFTHKPYNDLVDSVKTLKENWSTRLKAKLQETQTWCKIHLGFNYFFNELPEANIQHALANGQVIIWTSQALSSLAGAALNEDNFGVAQKDLPVIVSTLVELKQSVDKLGRVPALSRRIPDDLNSKMKGSVSAAVRRSIVRLCLDYMPYFKDLNLKKDVLLYVQNVYNGRNC